MGFDLAFLNRPEAVALGELPNAEAVHIHGENIYAVTGENALWDFGFGALYDFPTEPQLFKMKSTSIEDDSSPPGFTGAFGVNVEGLDENWQPKDRWFRMNGTTIVPAVKTLRRVNRMYVTNVGSSGFNIGNIGLYQDDGTTLIGLIPIGHNKSTPGVYTVPDGKRLLVFRAEYRCTVASGCELVIRNQGALEDRRPLELSSSDGLNSDRNGAFLRLPIAFSVGSRRDIEPISTQVAASSSAHIDIDAVLFDE